MKKTLLSASRDSLPTKVPPGIIRWSAALWGSGVDYLLSEEGSQHLNITLCRQKIHHYEQQRSLSERSVSLSGELTLAAGEEVPEHCPWTLEVSHGEMGKELVRSSVAFHRSYTDRNFTSSQGLLTAMTQHLGAQLIDAQQENAMEEVKQALLPYIESMRLTHRTTQPNNHPLGLTIFFKTR